MTARLVPGGLQHITESLEEVSFKLNINLRSFLDSVHSSERQTLGKHLRNQTLDSQSLQDISFRSKQSLHLVDPMQTMYSLIRKVNRLNR